MAIFHAQSIPLSRSSGRSAVAAAAYRAADELVDERDGRTHDYSRKRGVVESAVVLPDGQSIERGVLWNAAEAAENRKNARTAREWVVALPHELGAHERAELVREFAAELAERYGVAVDLAIHAPHREGDQRNWHAHLLATTRAVTRDADGRVVLGEKASIELSDAYRRKAGLGSGAQELEVVRARWAELANRALERAGRVERIDHRSLKAQGIDREATVHLGPVASTMERRGRPSSRGDVNRAVAGANALRIELGAQMAEMHAELGAVVIDLEAERTRLAERKRERAEKAAAAARAVERIAQEQAERERAELEHLQPERAREEAAREAHERLERMSSEELSQEIRRHLPPIRAFVEKLPPVVAARERAEGLAEELKQTQRTRRQAEREIEVFRAEHPVRAKLHDLGITEERYLRTRAEFEAAAPERLKQLKQHVRAAADEYAAVQKRERERIDRAREPQREHVARLHELLRDKRAQEREQQRVREEIERSAARLDEHVRQRQRQAVGYRDEDPRWQALPEKLREVVERCVATPKEERAALLQQELRRAPELQRALSLGRGLGRGR